MCMFVVVAMVSAKHCYKKEKNGFSAVIGMVANNVNVAPGYQLSFTESCGIAIDYKNQQMSISYEIIDGGNLYYGQLYAFGANNTQYVLSNGTCSEMPLSYPVPSSLPTNFTQLPKVRLGKYKVDVIQFTDTEADTTVQALYDGEDCAVVSTLTANNGLDGFAIANYFDYTNKVNPQLFELPVECQTANVFKLAHAKFHNIQLPNTVHLL
ncbi:hypothetical protein DLAC_03641 [Tieghemostelium lacteum]|uniref:Uncharacterized protein n=1 Tax=Tieghemostelium lacteum TaxID=361077 RepID=A0A152A0B5_TIELA|nr:hypothetical protein DLAC_03641 [Tieghemostelium lacteum]|eukprot:KYQ99701.1 hypothetical protein DLAC_03641 [Tieghemostelium lacteum]